MHQSPPLGETDQSWEDIEESTTWDLAEGAELAPGYFAWDLLGVGRRFEMWVAWCADRLTPVGVKMPRRDQMNQRTFDALRREYRTTIAFDHPAIPRVFAADLDAERPYIVQEFIEGKPLSLLLEEGRRYDGHDLAFLGLQLAAVLRHIHGRGYVHLDLKPSNIAMRGDRAMVFDFDIALPIGGVRSATKPRGTHHYMAPEQIRCEPAHPSMDLFALGAVLYEAASLRRAFAFDTDDEPTSSDGDRRPHRQLLGPASPTTEVAPHLAPDIAAAIEALLAVDPSDRPPTADDALLMLDRTLTGDRLWPAWVSETILASPAVTAPWNAGNPHPEARVSSWSG